MFIRKGLVLMAVVALSCGSALGTVSYFDGGGDGVNWTDADNWTAGIPSSSGGIEAQLKAGSGFDVVANGTGLTASKLYVGNGTTTYSLTVQSDLYVSDVLYSGAYGLLTVDSGTLSGGRTSWADTAVTINDGGTVLLRLSQWAITGSTIVTLNEGGTFKIQNGTAFGGWYAPSATASNADFTGIIDFCGGEWILDGDDTAAVTWHLNNGNFRVNGEAATSENLVITYDADTDLTTVAAIPEPATLILLGLGSCVLASRRRR